VLGSSPANKKEMVGILCENLKWGGEKLHWDWKKPYFYLAKPLKGSTWLRNNFNVPRYFYT